MKASYTHTLAVAWTSSLNRYVQKEGIDLQKMTLGLEIILHNIPKLVLMTATAAFWGILPQTMITWLSFACIRRYSSGLHASNGITCTFMTLLMFVAAPIALQNLYIGATTLTAIFAIIGLALYKYAPADTASRPILGSKKRARLKKKAVVTSTIVLALSLLFVDSIYYVNIVTGAIYTVIVALPLTYQILGRSMKCESIM